MTKVYKRYNLLIQLVILVVSYFFIINQVFWKQDLPALLNSLEDELASPGFLATLAFILLLMAVNWTLEAMKWQLLISKIEKVSLGRALVAVLTGVTISSFTPNRVGEFFGRVFILKRASHVEGILITVLGSMSQLLVTAITGSLALLVFLPLFLGESAIFNGYLYIGLVALVLFLDTLLLGLFFSVPFLATFKEMMLQKGLAKLRKFFRVFTLYTNRELWAVMALSLARYVVFSTQYMLLLKALGVNTPFFYTYLLISLVYFVMAIIPTIALTELGIRGSVAIYFFSFYFSPMMVATPELNLGILMASVLLWFINLGIPAVAGSVFLFRLQFFRNES